jgi:hypothetical protein
MQSQIKNENNEPYTSEKCNIVTPGDGPEEPKYVVVRQ